MEAFPIVVGTASLLSAITTLSIRLNEFRQTYTEAVSEIDGLTRELSDLSTVIIRLHEAGGADALPGLEKDLNGVLANCNRTIKDTEKHLQQASSRRFPGVYWAFSGKRECLQLCRGLEAHKSTLNITLSLSSLIENQKIQGGINDLIAGNHQIHDEIGRIISDVQNLRRTLPTQTHNSNYILRRFLEEAESYAGSVYEGSTTMGDPIDRDLERPSCEERQSSNMIEDFGSNTPPTHQLDHISEPAEHNQRTSTRRPPPSAPTPQLSDLRTEWTSRDRAHQLFSRISGYLKSQQALSFNGRYLALLLERRIDIEPMPQDLENLGFGRYDSPPTTFVLLLDFETGGWHTCVVSPADLPPNDRLRQYCGMSIFNKSVMILAQESAQDHLGARLIKLSLQVPHGLVREGKISLDCQGFVHKYAFSLDGEEMALCVKSLKSGRGYRVQGYHVTERSKLFDRSLWEFLPEDRFTSSPAIDITLVYNPATTAIVLYSSHGRVFSILNSETGELIAKQALDKASGFLLLSQVFSKAAYIKSGVITVRDMNAKSKAESAFSYRFAFNYPKVVFLPGEKLMLAVCIRSGWLYLLNAEKVEQIKKWTSPLGSMEDVRQNYGLVVSGDGRVAVITHPEGVWGWGASTSH